MFKMENDTFDVLANIQRVVLPALGTLYFALAGIWGLPYGEAVVGTIAAVDAFLGAILKISSVRWAKEQKNAESDNGD